VRHERNSEIERGEMMAETQTGKSQREVTEEQRTPVKR
jgi:hypothetical protein